MQNAHLLAQNPQDLGPIGDGPGFGPFTTSVVSTNPFIQIASIVSTIIGIITICAGIYFMFQFLISGFGWITASGDKNRLQMAQNRMTYATIGMVIVVATYAIMSIVGTIAGLDLLLSNPGELLRQLQLGGTP